jgi:prolyl-tRNA editing enzyme YbaK/EbsC (Cys-tRNA(Pro) deacylase)
MSALLKKAEDALGRAGLKYKAMDCDPALADTAAFCEHYGFTPGQSANAILVAGKADPTKYACCVVLATHKLDVNKMVCKKLGVKRASFAGGDVTQELSGMEIGGVTPFGLPEDIPIFVDAAVLGQPEVVMGGGNRSSKVVLDPRELSKFPGVEIVPDLAKLKEI